MSLCRQRRRAMSWAPRDTGLPSFHVGHRAMREAPTHATELVVGHDDKSGLAVVATDHLKLRWRATANDGSTWSRWSQVERGVGRRCAATTG